MLSQEDLIKKYLELFAELLRDPESMTDPRLEEMDDIWLKMDKHSARYVDLATREEMVMHKQEGG